MVLVNKAKQPGIPLRDSPSRHIGQWYSQSFLSQLLHLWSPRDCGGREPLDVGDGDLLKPSTKDVDLALWGGQIITLRILWGSHICQVDLNFMVRVGLGDNLLGSLKRVTAPATTTPTTTKIPILGSSEAFPPSRERKKEGGTHRLCMMRIWLPREPRMGWWSLSTRQKILMAANSGGKKNRG